MKRLLFILIAGVVVAGLSGCDKEDKTPTYKEYWENAALLKKDRAWCVAHPSVRNDKCIKAGRVTSHKLLCVQLGEPDKECKAAYLKNHK